MPDPDPSPDLNDSQTAPGAAAVADRRGNRRRYFKPFVLLAVIALTATLLISFGDLLKLDYLATKEAQLRSFQNQHPVLVYGIAFALYVVVTGLSLPGAAALSLLYAWYFGFGPAVLLVSFASTAGATVAFLTSRYLLRETVQSRFGPRLGSFNRHLEQEGALYLFTLRLVPLVPFFVINLVMGLTPLKVRTFWWVSQVGMLPGTLVYVYAGSRVPNLSQLAEGGLGAVLSPSQAFQLTVALALLGIFPIVVKQIMKYVTAARRPQPLDADSEG